MDPVIIAALVTSSALLVIEVVKILRKINARHFHSSCCDIELENEDKKTLPDDMESKQNHLVAN